MGHHTSHSLFCVWYHISTFSGQQVLKGWVGEEKGSWRLDLMWNPGTRGCSGSKQHGRYHLFKFKTRKMARSSNLLVLAVVACATYMLLPSESFTAPQVLRGSTQHEAGALAQAPTFTEGRAVQVSMAATGGEPSRLPLVAVGLLAGTAAVGILALFFYGSYSGAGSGLWDSLNFFGMCFSVDYPGKLRVCLKQDAKKKSCLASVIVWLIQAFLIILETRCYVVGISSFEFGGFWMSILLLPGRLGGKWYLGLTRNCYGPPLQNPNAQWFILGGCKVQSSTIEIWANSPNFRWFSYADEMTRHEAKKGFPHKLVGISSWSQIVSRSLKRVPGIFWAEILMPSPLLFHQRSVRKWMKSRRIPGLPSSWWRFASVLSTDIFSYFVHCLECSWSFLVWKLETVTKQMLFLGGYLP